MQKKLKKIHDFLFYPGVERSDYISIRPEIRQANREMTIALSAIATVLIAIMLSLSFDKKSGVTQNMIVYAVGLVVSITVLVLALTKAKANDKLILPLMYLAYSTYYLYGIFIGAVTDPGGKTVTFIAMLVLMPTLFIDRPIRTIGITALFITIFIVISSFTKSPEVFNVDVIDAVIFGVLGAATGTVRSIKDARAHKTRLEYEKLSRIDGLTRLNRREVLFRDINIIEKKKFNQFACIYVDVNDLKIINDQGKAHDKGDKCLSTVAKCISKHFGYTYTYRVGGDEFVILCIDMQKRRIDSLLNKMKADVEAAGYGISIGVERYDPEKPVNVVDMIKLADSKMYIDKERQKAEKAAKNATIAKDR